MLSISGVPGAAGVAPFQAPLRSALRAGLLSSATFQAACAGRLPCVGAERYKLTSTILDVGNPRLIGPESYILMESAIDLTKQLLNITYALLIKVIGIFSRHYPDKINESLTYDV